MAEEIGDASEQAAPSRGRKRILMVGVLASVMIIESVVVFVLVKSWSPAAGPAPAHAQTPGLVATEGEKAPKPVEVKVGEFRAQNRRGQQSYVLNFSVYAKVAENDKVKVEEDLVAQAATIKDRLVRVVRGMEPERFAESDLMTLRTQVKEALRGLLGSDIKIEEVLLTDFTAVVEN